jgi:hypothetical protein
MSASTRRRLGRRGWAVGFVCAGALVALGATAGFAGADVAPCNTPYTGEVVFVRLRYDAARGRGCGALPQFVTWAHDYPRAEQNLTRILEAVTYIDPFQGPNGGNVLALDDPELYKFPAAYMSEPGHWYPSEAEVLGLREYVEKGGFLIFDDFWGAHWDNFTAQMRRVLPDARLLPVELAHPVFHSFFEIESLEMEPMYYGLPVEFHGVFENNDPSGRLIAIANYNNDIGEYWEYSDTGWVPIDLSNEAYKFGVNYLMYALTH